MKTHAIYASFRCCSKRLEKFEFYPGNLCWIIGVWHSDVSLKLARFGYGHEMSVGA